MPHNGGPEPWARAQLPTQCCCPAHRFRAYRSFFTDAYDLYMVGVITPMIAFARFPDHVKGGNFGSLPDNYDLVIKGMALVGTLVGQVSTSSIRPALRLPCLLNPTPRPPTTQAFLSLLGKLLTWRARALGGKVLVVMLHVKAVLCL